MLWFQAMLGHGMARTDDEPLISHVFAKERATAAIMSSLQHYHA